METSIVNQNFSSDDPGWVVVAELSLRDFLLDQDRRDEPMAGSLFRTVRELGVAPECMEDIARMLAGLAKESSQRTKQEKMELPGRIRIFCQKKVLDDPKSMKTSGHSRPEQPENQKQISPDAMANTIDGWGYFMLERGEGFPPDSSAISHHSIDLYLYKEGQ